MFQLFRVKDDVNKRNIAEPLGAQSLPRITEESLDGIPKIRRFS